MLPSATPYEIKFAQFIRLCEEVQARGASEVIIAFPWTIGDTYEEIIESLGRLADAGLSLRIAARKR